MYLFVHAVRYFAVNSAFQNLKKYTKSQQRITCYNVATWQVLGVPVSGIDGGVPYLFSPYNVDVVVMPIWENCLNVGTGYVRY